MAMAGRKPKRIELEPGEFEVELDTPSAKELGVVEVVSEDSDSAKISKSKKSECRVKLTQEILTKLEVAYKFGAEDKEACAFANITLSKMKSLMREYPALCEFISNWKQQPIMMAKRVVYESIKKGNVEDAKWLLERLVRDKYGKTVKMEHRLGIDKPKEEPAIELVERERKSLRASTGVIEAEYEVKEGDKVSG